LELIVLLMLMSTAFPVAVLAYGFWSHSKLLRPVRLVSKVADSYRSSQSPPPQQMITEAVASLKDSRNEYYQFLGMLMDKYHDCLSLAYSELDLHNEMLSKELALGFDNLSSAMEDGNKLLMAHSIAYLAQVLLRGELPRKQLPFPRSRDRRLGLPYSEDSQEGQALLHASRNLRELKLADAEHDIENVIYLTPSLESIFVFGILRACIYHIDKLVTNEEKRRLLSVQLADSIGELFEKTASVEKAVDILIEAWKSINSFG